MKYIFKMCPNVFYLMEQNSSSTEQMIICIDQNTSVAYALPQLLQA